MPVQSGSSEMSEQMSLFDFSGNAQTPQGLAQDIARALDGMCIGEKVAALNDVRRILHAASPFHAEPVDLVQWVAVDDVAANDYNPNSVAPPEMELLRHSINHDGYTQPVVTWNAQDGREVIDGFHRTRVCKELDDVRNRVQGFLPVVTINDDCVERNDRIASTIRHNRARGKHRVDSMSDIVLELKKRNWTDRRVAKELGMDEDEILRLCQVSGLSDLFDNQDFSAAWDIGIFDEGDFQFDDEGEPVEHEEGGRIYHTWDKWECFGANFYGTSAPSGMTGQECEEAYRELLSNAALFDGVLDKVLNKWPHSCEHYLTNESMNRIAWLGQAALAYEHGIPACFRGGYNLLTESEQQEADRIAMKHLNQWLLANGRTPVDVDTVESKTQANMY